MKTVTLDSADVARFVELSAASKRALEAFVAASTDPEHAADWWGAHSTWVSSLQAVNACVEVRIVDRATAEEEPFTEPLSSIFDLSTWEVSEGTSRLRPDGSLEIQTGPFRKQGESDAS